MPAFEQVFHGFLVDKAAAGTVDQDQAFLCLLQCFAGEDIPGLLRQRNV